MSAQAWAVDPSESADVQAQAQAILADPELGTWMSGVWDSLADDSGYDQALSSPDEVRSYTGSETP